MFRGRNACLVVFPVTSHAKRNQVLGRIASRVPVDVMHLQVGPFCMPVVLYQTVGRNTIRATMVVALTHNLGHLLEQVRIAPQFLEPRIARAPHALGMRQSRAFRRTVCRETYERRAAL